MRNAYCAGMTQLLGGKRLDSLRSETSAAQSIFPAHTQKRETKTAIAGGPRVL